MIKRLFLLLSLSSWFVTTVAGSFQLFEQDASGIGDVHAGAAAEANSAGTEYYNPAGMTNLDDFELSAGLAYLPLDIDFSGLVGADPYQNYVVAQSHTDNFIPNFHIVYPWEHRVAFGFGVTVPFGASTSFPELNPLAFSATKTKLETVNLNPNIAFALNDHFSVGIGFDALHGKADYNTAFPIPDDTEPPSLLLNNLAGWGYGWNAGFLVNVTPLTRVGVSYRSTIKVDAKGTSSYLDNDAGETTSTKKLKAAINFPATTMISFYHEINSRFSILFSANHTDWSDFKDLTLSPVEVMGIPATLIVHEDYKNTWDLAAGLHIWLLSNLQFKIGFGYSETPTQLGERDVRLPDANRYALGLGLHWQIIKSVALDIGWTRFFIDQAKVDNSNGSAFIINGEPYEMFSDLIQTIGIANTRATVVGFQLSWKPGC